MCQENSAPFPWLFVYFSSKKTHFWNSQQFWSCQGGHFAFGELIHNARRGPKCVMKPNINDSQIHRKIAFFRSNMADMEAHETHGHSGHSGHSVLSGHFSGHQDHGHPAGGYGVWEETRLKPPNDCTILLLQFAMKLTVRVSSRQMKHSLVRFRTSSLTCFWIFESSSLTMFSLTSPLRKVLKGPVSSGKRKECQRGMDNLSQTSSHRRWLAFWAYLSHSSYSHRFSSTIEGLKSAVKMMKPERKEDMRTRQ